MLKPPPTVQLVMEAVCVICYVPPIPIPDPQNPKLRIQSYWEASKKFLSDKDFLKKLINYEKDAIPPELMTKLRDKYIKNPEFNAKRAEKASSACKGLCEWVLVLFYFLN
jgi:dynein heavy chain